MCAKTAAQDGDALTTKTYLLKTSDGDLLAAYTSLRKAAAQRKALKAARRAVIEAKAPLLVGREYLKLSRSGATATFAKHDAESARVYAGYDVPDVVLVTLDTDTELDPLATYPMPVAQIEEQPYTPETYPCPSCGEQIEVDSDFKGGDYLTWCDRCPWHGFVNEHLKAGDKEGAKLFS